MPKLSIVILWLCIGVSFAAARNISVSRFPLIAAESAFAADSTNYQPPAPARKSTASDFFFKLFLLAIVALTITGIVYGITNQAIFYYDRNDMMFSCTPYISVIVGGFLTMITEWQWLFWLGLILAVILFISIVSKSFEYNKTGLMSMSTAVAKLVLSFLVVIQVMSALSPSGANTSKRRYNRSSALVWLMFLLPLVYLLTNGKKVLAAREDAATTLAPVNESE